MFHTLTDDARKALAERFAYWQSAVLYREGAKRKDALQDGRTALDKVIPAASYEVFVGLEEAIAYLKAPEATDAHLVHLTSRETLLRHSAGCFRVKYAGELAWHVTMYFSGRLWEVEPTDSQGKWWSVREIRPIPMEDEAEAPRCKGTWKEVLDTIAASYLGK